MLKPLLLITKILVDSAIVSTTTLQTANATIIVAQSSTHLDRSIAKGYLSDRINAQQQSDIDGIHATLTQFYGGINEYNVDRMARLATPIAKSNKECIRQSFARAKDAGVNISFEIKNIELISLSDSQAKVKIEQLASRQMDGRLVSERRFFGTNLVKYHGSWKVVYSKAIRFNTLGELCGSW
jgi:hypothetical protein